MGDAVYSKYMVAVEAEGRVLYALDGTGEAWSDRPATITEDQHPGAVRFAADSGLPYDVVREDVYAIGKGSAPVRVGGTRQMVRI